MVEYPNGRQVFPWCWPLIENIRQWLNSYLGHTKRASAYRLIRSLRNRFAWLAEYFHWGEGKVIQRYPIPRFTLRFSQQKRWFQKHLLGHVLMIRQGGFWEMDAESCVAVAPIFEWPSRFPNRRMRHVKEMLWKSGLSVAWIEETGRRLSNIAERALVCRWAHSN